MNNPVHPDDTKVSIAFQRLLKTALEHLSKTEKVTRDSLQTALDEAVELELAAEELTRDELGLLAQYVKRDLSHMGEYLNETGDELASWLSFDLGILEEVLKQKLLMLADNTRVDMEKLRERLDAGDTIYMADEFATPGAFTCCGCEQEVILLVSRRISVCDNCGSEQFLRKTDR